MEKEIKYYPDEPFDTDKVEKLDMETIDSGIELGTKRLEYQYETISNIRDNCKMILGWLIGAMMALIGVLALNAASENPNIAILVASLYELVFTAGIAFSILHGAMFRRSVALPGESPSFLFRDTVFQALDGFENWNKYIKGWELHAIQFNILWNIKEQAHEVKVYRCALALCLVALVSGGTLLAILILLGL